MAHRAARFVRWICAVAALTAAVPAAAGADPAAGITGTADFATFDTANPGGLTSRPISGLQAPPETVIALDWRPATGGLFISTVPTGVAANALIRSYSLDPGTATATFVGSIPAATVPGAGDSPTGADFNANVDRLRVVNSGNENYRINPNNGTLAGNDVNLTYTAPATGPVTGIAYDRNVDLDGPNVPAPPGTPITLYGIDVGADRLVTIGGINGETPGGPNGGAVRSEGALGVAVDNDSDAGFDIAPNGSAFASLLVGGQPGLYRINLAGGAATLLGALPIQVRELTITGPDNCPGVAGDNQADQDGDGQGDACDGDIDGDGVANDVETARGSDPRKVDTDADAVGDGTDQCPAVAGAAPTGCPPPPTPDTTKPTITIGRAPSRMTRAKFLEGVSSRISGNEPVALEVALLGKARTAGLARTADVVLAERNLGLSAAARSLKLKPKRSLVGSRKRFTVRLRVIATDAAGNRGTKTKTIRIR